MSRNGFRETYRSSKLATRRVSERRIVIDRFRFLSLAHGRVDLDQASERDTGTKRERVGFRTVRKDSIAGASREYGGAALREPTGFNWRLRHV